MPGCGPAFLRPLPRNATPCRPPLRFGAGGAGPQHGATTPNGRTATSYCSSTVLTTPSGAQPHPTATFCAGMEDNSRLDACR
eukprot:13050449-Heterocapsa_arctica.AAC.1